MKNTLIHVGFPKTSTTWIQECFFSEHPDLYYLGTTLTKPANKDISTPRVGWLPLLANVHSNDFDAEHFRQEADKTMSDDKLNCISYEGLVGDPFNNWFIPEVRGRRLAKVFPNAKIVITLREQRSYLSSMYGEYLKAGGTYPLKALLDWDEGKVGRHEAFVLSQLKYDKIIQYYHDLFGKENVLVLLYEDFCWDRLIYLERICQFVRINTFIPDGADYTKKNVGFKHYLTGSLLRHANKLVKSNLHPYHIFPRLFLYTNLMMLDRIFCRINKNKDYGRERVIAPIESQLIEYYQKSNNNLQKIVDAPIDSFWT